MNLLLCLLHTTAKMDANLKDALENVSKALYTMSSVSAEASALLENIKGSILPSVEELPSIVSEEPMCDICGTCSSPWREVYDERGLCLTCAEHMDEGLNYYTEEFTHASEHGKDALHLFVLRQRADNCRGVLAEVSGSYDGYLCVHDVGLEEKILNKRAAECLARLPASFAPWWKDTWIHEKWCEIYHARKAVGWALASKDAPVVQRLAAMFVAEQHKTHELKKAHAEELQIVEKRLNGEMEVVIKQKLKEMEVKHADLLANIQCAFQAMRSDLERLSTEKKALQNENKLLLRLVGPTQKLMASNPELFGGEAHGSSLPVPPPTLLTQDDKGETVNFLNLITASRPTPLVERLQRLLPSIVKAEVSAEGLGMAMTETQYQQMLNTAVQPPLPPSPPASPVPDQPAACGAADCIDCPIVAKPVAQRVAKRSNYNHPNWPSPITKRFAKHLAKHSGSHDPKTIKTHHDALEYIAKRAKVSVETLLKWTINHYQSFSEPWTLVKDSSRHFHMGATPVSWRR